MKHIILKQIEIDLNKLFNYRFYFVGILGSGMSSLAAFLKTKGCEIAGSDRGYTNFDKSELSEQLTDIGCKIFSQNGFHINENYDFVVVSSAIERNNPDVEKAIELNIKIIHRADLLAYLVNNNYGITIGGTSGKSTTTGFLGFILKKSNIDVNIITGAAIKNITSDNQKSNYVSGNSKYVLVECDESDGTIVKFQPQIAVLNNISKDHKTVEELLILFQEYVNNCKSLIVYNKDDFYCNELDFQNKKTVSIGKDLTSDYRITDIKIDKNFSEFCVNGNFYKIKVPGEYNIYNAVMAIAVSFELGLDYEIISKNILKFDGVKDRFEILNKGDTEVILDYAHNPIKIESLLNYITKFYNNILFIYQPHGFAPTYFTKNELLEVFEKYFKNNNKLILRPIYYAGGTVTKKITSLEIIEILKNKNCNCDFFEKSDLIFDYINDNSKNYDVIVIAGARDSKLISFSKEIVSKIIHKK
jgi:UDP-N-acetylmuramate--alanine ligase